MTSDPVEMWRRAEWFYSDLFTAGGMEECCSEVLLTDLPKKDQAQNQAVDTALAFEEVTEAVHQLTSGRAPGIDDLPVAVFIIWGRDLVANNVIASALWYKFTVLNPPGGQINGIQRALVDFFWSALDEICSVVSGALRVSFLDHVRRGTVWITEELLAEMVGLSLTNSHSIEHHDVICHALSELACEYINVRTESRTVTVVKEWTDVTMETSPLGELVKALSLLQQTHHQALLDAQRENQARFEALAQGQEADRRLLQSLLSGPLPLASFLPPIRAEPLQ
ncbi:hypothetical protein AOLI_G00137680 [Acnodon oligacanthus]